MDYQSLVEDFARRTRTNLAELNKLKAGGAQVFEVTALMNSMLGLLIFPQQSYVDSIPEVPVAELAKHGWPIPKIVDNYQQVSNLRQLVRYLRNAISHFNLKFKSDIHGQIVGLVVWNQEPRGKRITWKAELSVHELEAIATNFVALLLRESPLAVKYVVGQGGSQE